MIQAELAVCRSWVKLPPTKTVLPTCAKARVSPSRACGVVSAGFADTRVAVAGTGTTAADAFVGTPRAAAMIANATIPARVRRRPAKRHKCESLGTLRLQIG